MYLHIFWSPCDLRNPNLSSKKLNLVHPFQVEYCISTFSFESDSRLDKGRTKFDFLVTDLDSGVVMQIYGLRTVNRKFLAVNFTAVNMYRKSVKH